MPLLKIKGILIATLLAAISPFAIGIIKNNQYLTISFNLSKIWNYIKFGFPITLSSFVWILITSSTIWVVSVFYAPEYTGIFGFAMLTSTVFKVLPGVLGEITGPRFLTFLGKAKDNKENVNDAMVQASLAWSGINVLFAVFSLLALRLLILYWVPQYTAGWTIMLFIILGYYCHNCVNTAGNAAIHSGKAPLLLAINVVILVVQVGIAILVAKCSSSFPLIGLATMSGLIVSSLSVLYVAFFDRSKVLNVGNNLFLILISMSIGVMIICLSWYLTGIIDKWYWMLIMVPINIGLCLLPSIRGYNNLRRFWRTTAF